MEVTIKQFVAIAMCTHIHTAYLTKCLVVVEASAYQDTDGLYTINICFVSVRCIDTETSSDIRCFHCVMATVLSTYDVNVNAFAEPMHPCYTYL